MEMPEMIGKYRIEGKLGQGGMGEVYKGFDTELERWVALKFVKEERLQDERARARFMQEAKAIASLNHSSIVQIYDLLHWQDQEIIVMEFVEGEDLEEILERKGRLPVGRLLPLARQITEGLAEAHKSVKAHRDLKPRNVMVTFEKPQRAKLLDFGLAKMEGDEELTGEHNIVGTLQYMSPEQTYGKEVDWQTDLFALGVLIYRALTGISPFAGRDLGETFIRIRKHLPDPLHVLDPAIPKELSRLVERLLQKEPGKRPANVADVAAALEGLEAHRQTRASAMVDSSEMTIDLRTKSKLSREGRNISREGCAVLRTILACDLAEDARLNQKLGDQRMAALRRRLEETARELHVQYGGTECVHDGVLLLLFDRPINAVACALALQGCTVDLADGDEFKPEIRAAIHVGEILFTQSSTDGSMKVDGLAKAVVMSLLSLAIGSQILLT